MEPGQGPVVWQEIACPLCSARAEEPVLEAPWDGGPPFRLVRCGACGMGYLNPRPDEASIGRFYTDDYEWYHAPPRGDGWWSRLKGHLERLTVRRRCGVPPPLRGWGERLLARLADPWFAPSPDSLTALPYLGEGRLLEYGCGSAWYGARMRRLGWDVTGMDFSAYAAEQARRRFGLRVIVGSLPHPEVGPESYDVVTLGAVLEHVHWPHQVIGAAARALRPGGRLVVSVPNFACWAFRFFGADWWGLQTPVHLLHFTPATLRRLLEEHGLEVRQTRLLAKPGWMRRSMVAAGRRPGAWRWLWRLGRLRLPSGWLARWTARRGQGDCLLMIAARPASLRVAAA
jgi:SAM-dependent methyltransferase